MTSIVVNSIGLKISFFYDPENLARHKIHSNDDNRVELMCDPEILVLCLFVKKTRFSKPRSFCRSPTHIP